MRAEFTPTGGLVIIPETPAEAIALAGWLDCKVVDEIRFKQQERYDGYAEGLRDGAAAVEGRLRADPPTRPGPAWTDPRRAMHADLGQLRIELKVDP